MQSKSARISSDEQAWDVLQDVDRYKDAEIGINWLTLEMAAGISSAMPPKPSSNRRRNMSHDRACIVDQIPHGSSRDRERTNTARSDWHVLTSTTPTGPKRLTFRRLDGSRTSASCRHLVRGICQRQHRLATGALMDDIVESQFITGRRS